MSEQLGAPPPQGSALQSATRLYCSAFMRCLPLSLLGSACLLLAGNQWSARAQSKADPLGQLESLDLSSIDPNTLDLNSLSSLTDVNQLLANEFSASQLISWGLTCALFVVFCGALCLQLNSFSDTMVLSGRAALSKALMRAGPALVACAVWLIVSVGCLALMAVPHVSAVWPMLLLLPSIYWSGRLQFWLLPVFVERAGAWKSLRDSAQLTRQHWWRAVSELTVAMIIIGLIELLLDGVIALSTGELGASSASGWRALLTRAQLLNWLSGAVLLPMVPAALLVIYRQLQRVQTQSANRKLESATRH